MAKKNKDSKSTRMRRSPEERIAAMEAKVALAKERLENSEHSDHPAVKLMLATRSMAARFWKQLAADAGPLSGEEFTSLASLIEDLDLVAPKYGGHRRKEEAA